MESLGPTGMKRWKVEVGGRWGGRGGGGRGGGGGRIHCLDECITISNIYIYILMLPPYRKYMIINNYEEKKSYTSTTMTILPMTCCLLMCVNYTNVDRFIFSDSESVHILIQIQKTFYQ